MLCAEICEVNMSHRGLRDHLLFELIIDIFWALIFKLLLNKIVENAQKFMNTVFNINQKEQSPR